MKALLAHAGPGFSVSDVGNGWVKGLRACGVEVAEFDFSERLWAWTHAFVPNPEGELVQAMALEDAIVAAFEPIGTFIYTFWPDIVILVSGFWAKPEALDIMRARGQKVVLLCTESPYEDDRQIALAAHADVTLVNDPTNIERFHEVCPATFYAPHSYDPELHHPGPWRSKLASDLCIVGTGYPSRIEWLEKADLHELDVAFVGNWQAAEGTPLEQHCREGLEHCVDNAETVEWYRATRCSLNLYRREADRPELSAGWSMGPREIELAATGTFFLTEPRGENRSVLPMVPAVTDPAEFRDLYDWWMRHDREREQVVADARSAVADWTFARRATSFLNLLDPVLA